MSGQHTPGPWKLEADMRSERVGDMYDALNGYNEYLAGWNVVSDGQEIIGCEGIIPGGSAEANARLISAAPDMHAALVVAREALASAVIEASGGMFNADTVGKHLVIAQIDAALTLAGDKS